MTRVAAIDCGTNSIRLLIAEIGSTADHPERTRGSSDLDQPSSVNLADLTRKMRIVRLGEGVDRTGRLSEAALDGDLAGYDSARIQHARMAAARVHEIAGGCLP